MQLPENMTWKQKEAYIKGILAANDAAVCRALVVLYSKQTAAEQASDSTKEDNGVGFTSVDAQLLSSYAQQYRRWGKLTPKQMEWARKKVTKYWRQLWFAAVEKQERLRYVALQNAQQLEIRA